VHPDGSLVAYLASLDRVAALAPDVLLPGHGPAVLDPLPTIERLVAHRRLREDRVVAALSATQACAVEALIPTIYADVSPALYPMARHTLLSHLVKLESEQRVRQTEPDLWQLV
jgi:glyoxylase-like metal-dependent hydrolase (beta-lactamase superfamily II)